MTSDMSDTHYHGEEISADTYTTLRRYQFNLESLEERLERMENTTATMKEKWRRGDEAMRDFTGIPEHRSTTPTESTASCNAVKILTHKEFAAKHSHPPSPDNVRIDRHANSNINRHSEDNIDRQPSPPIDR
ncbi:hypothetical protein F2Q69_00042873 [Brassica cretica]|uniref:Uncharacterized protein n=1 Tax=Brassica cretica TaxID=69181 RepID=A0A8S9NLS1_BRACR|nr:hypothetical protein F2Q69_00042873 [Brassica cretica]